MKKTALALSLSTLMASFYAQSSFATNAITLYNQPLTTIEKFSIDNGEKKQALTAATSPQNEQQLTRLKQVTMGTKTYTRYQQTYKGIPIVGKQVVIEQSKGAQAMRTATSNPAKVSGSLVEDISLNTQAKLSPQEAINLAKKTFSESYQNTKALSKERSQLQILFNDNKPQLVYRVSFRTQLKQGKPMAPNFIIDANNGTILKTWDNIQHYDYKDSGPGGNEKVGQYWYGKDALINDGLTVNRQNDTCIMDNQRVRLIDLQGQDEGIDDITQEKDAYRYACGNNQGDPINGAFSPINDAFYFGDVIINTYQDWYQIPALVDKQGNPATLIMRVHFSTEYDNAFWDGLNETMNFGDGETNGMFYPLVSLDVAGHEVSHGFTQQHSGLIYKEQSGAINEAFSDMAGQAVRAYLLSKQPELYKAMYNDENEVTWDIGKTIFRGSSDQALRYMDQPSKDKASADCLNKRLAKQFGQVCKINFNDVKQKARSYYPLDQFGQDSYIVHTASGTFNKAFYHLSQKFGIKKAFNIMVLANVKYWNPTSDYKNAACGVKNAAKDLQLDTKIVDEAFGKVGIQTC